jgi:arginine/lysine/ornithine decarboxylase
MYQDYVRDVDRMLQNHYSFWERQKRVPLFEALIRHAMREPHPFHVPGHKMGRSFDRGGRDWYGSILPLDLTELNGLDDLHQPDGAIREAQALAAEAYGAEETRFLVGGSTAGNIALILAVCRPGEKIIVQRNCHKSVYNGILLARAHPVFVVPAVDPVTGAAVGLRREDVERTLMEHPDAKAVFITNPTYYGMGIDLKKLASTVHRFGVPLLVDEAHGSHYGFHPDLPASAMQSGADAAVQSTHKMSTAMTMSSMLHVQGNRLNRDRLFRILAMIQSSSPSYPLMASLDLARRHMVVAGRKEMDQVLPCLQQFRERVSTLSWVTLPAVTEESVYATLDPFKLMLCFRTRAITGFQLQGELEAQGIFPELAELGHVLLAASTGTLAEDVELVWNTLHARSPLYDDGAKNASAAGMLASHFTREQAMPMYEAADADAQSVPLSEAIGAVAAEMVIPYPPGIPLLVPGERIDQQAISLLQKLKESGTRFHGVKDPQLNEIQIVLGRNRW